MQFIANLRPQTLDAFAVQGIDPSGYLLSSHRITPALLEAAREVREKELPLLADNGTKVLIEETIERFRGPARELARQVKALRRRLGRVPRGRDIPGALRDAADSLAEEVLVHCTARSEALDGAALLKAQLSMNPTAIIAQEDFATACLMGLDLERETTGWPVARFITRNRRSLRLWRRVAEDPRCKGRRVYAVLSAMDYNTARAAGRIAAEAGVEAAALGMAAVTRDLNATDFYVMGRASRRLERPVPRRYVRLAQILRGLADGWRDRSRVLKRFHCLGLGAPALLPVAVLAFDSQTWLTTDATSPIHDAVRDRVLYDPEHRGDRASTREIVERIVEGGDWPFLSPFTRAFRERFGHDPISARRWWETRERPPITSQLLDEPSELSEALPLFAEADPEIRSQARDTRIAHNHWVLGNLIPGDTAYERRAVAEDLLEGWLATPATVTTRGLTIAKEVLLYGKSVHTPSSSPEARSPR